MQKANKLSLFDRELFKQPYYIILNAVCISVVTHIKNISHNLPVWKRTDIFHFLSVQLNALRRDLNLCSAVWNTVMILCFNTVHLTYVLYKFLSYKECEGVWLFSVPHMWVNWFSVAILTRWNIFLRLYFKNLAFITCLGYHEHIPFGHPHRTFPLTN